MASSITCENVIDATPSALYMEHRPNMVTFNACDTEALQHVDGELEGCWVLVLQVLDEFVVDTRPKTLDLRRET